MVARRRDVVVEDEIRDAAIVQVEQVLERRFGWHADPTRRESLLQAMRECAGRAGDRSLPAYADRLRVDPSAQEALGEQMSVGETFFFRTPQHFEAMMSVLEKKGVAQARNGEDRPLRVLSAACASGEEPYTVAMLLREREEQRAATGEGLMQVEIEAVDMDPSALAKAHAGIYTEWSMRSMDADRRARYFSLSGKRWLLTKDLRNAVGFRLGNLLELHPEMFADGFDVILCRNALIYFTPDSMRLVIDALTALLRPGGYLFLGPSETLRGVSANFNLCHTHETFYYQRKRDVVLPSLEKMVSMSAPMLLHVETDVEDEGSGSDGEQESWIGEIARSLQRLREMTSPLRVKALAKRVVKVSGLIGSDDSKLESFSEETKGAVKALIEPPVEIAAEDVFEMGMAETLQMVAEERFAAALVRVESLMEIGSTTQRHSAQLIRGAMLLSLGRTAEAMEACKELLETGEMTAAAHYMQSRCLEKMGEMESSIREAEAAVYLDPKLAMAQLHLGVLARRCGDAGRARLWFQSARDRLPEEDAVMLLLFGGGFSREGLQAVCVGEMGKLDGEA